MEFGKYVVLSTAHVRCATAEQLTTWALLPAMDQPLPVASTSCGWFLSTGVPHDAADMQFPSELLAVLAFGRDHGCAYVLLDCDGERADVLPVFPW